MWNNISSQSIRRLEPMIQGSYNAGGSMQRAEFINSDIRLGLDTLQ